MFCGFSALLLIPLLRQPRMLMYGKGIPIFSIVILLLAKLLSPHEFSFTRTLASKRILPAVRVIENFYFFRDITIGNLLLYIWIFIAIISLCRILFRHWKLTNIISIVPNTKNKEISMILSEFCIQKKIMDNLKVIQLDMNIGPFVTGFKNPTIVLPNNFSSNEIRFVLLHELEHLKYHHMFIKLCTEIVAAVYWWNPIVWFLRKKIICALEIQADAGVMGKLRDNVGFEYLDTLVKISKMGNSKHDINPALSFAWSGNTIGYRVHTALGFDCSMKSKRISVLSGLSMILSIVILLTSSMYTFESYNVSQSNVEGTFTINDDTDFFVLREDMLYDLYVNGEYTVTIPAIPEDLNNLPIQVRRSFSASRHN
jgi:beta-lactamase regulating signal transducer with metallopeptidase domain